MCSAKCTKSVRRLSPRFGPTGNVTLLNCNAHNRRFSDAFTKKVNNVLMAKRLFKIKTISNMSSPMPKIKVNKSCHANTSRQCQGTFFVQLEQLIPKNQSDFPNLIFLIKILDLIAFIKSFTFVHFF